MTKGDLMKLVFTPAQLQNIDCAIPDGAVPPTNYFWYVMDYNNSTVFGELVDMRKLIEASEEIKAKLPQSFLSEQS